MTKRRFKTVDIESYKDTPVLQIDGNGRFANEPDWVGFAPPEITRRFTSCLPASVIF